MRIKLHLWDLLQGSKFLETISLIQLVKKVVRKNENEDKYTMGRGPEGGG